jgi:subtilisin family serine protease
MQNKMPYITPQKHILVKFKDERNSENIKESIREKLFLKKLSINRKFKHSKIELLELHEEDDISAAVTELNNHTGTHYAQRDHFLYPCALSYGGKFLDQWSLKNIGQLDKYENAGHVGIDTNTLAAWEITKGSDAVIVAVIDTGIDIYHSGLRDNIYHNRKEGISNCADEDGNNYCDDNIGWDFLNKDNSVYDSILDAKHGTEVGGIIAASGFDSGTIGIAPNVKLLPLKIMDAHHGCTSAAIEAIEYAKTMGAKIVNCSWGDYTFNPALKFHIEDSGMLFVCAAGNDGIDLAEKPFYPACFDLPNVLSVAAINNRGELWTLSNYGDKINVAAPGVSIISTIPSNDEKGYDFDSGTSLAAPHVTGAAALIMSIIENISAQEIKLLIEQNVTQLSDLKGKVKTGGILNVYQTLKSATAHHKVV